MPYTDNPVRDYENYEIEQERRRSRAPVCDCCDRPILEEDFYYVHGEYICAGCMDREYRVLTSDFMDD